MSSQRLAEKRFLRAARGIAVGTAFMLPSLGTPAEAQEQVTTEALLDRIQIEDLSTRYYYDMSMGEINEGGGQPPRGNPLKETQ